MIREPAHPTSSMSDPLQAFCLEARQLLAAQPDAAGREAVRRRFERLLADPAFAERYCGPDLAPGSHRLYEDPVLGFTVIAYAGIPNRPESPPHDHGPDWAIYGQVRSYTDLRHFERIDAGESRETAGLREVARVRLQPGQAVLYEPGAIHTIAPADDCRYARIAGSVADHYCPIGPMSLAQREDYEAELARERAAAAARAAAR